MSHASQPATSQVSQPGRAYADGAPHAADRSADPSLGTLVSQLTSQVPELIRSELRLAQAEMTAKGKRAGIGLGMFSAAGLLSLFGLGFLLTTVALFAAAGVAALLGKKKVTEATPPKPERTVQSVKEDVAAVKGAVR